MSENLTWVLGLDSRDCVKEERISLLSLCILTYFLELYFINF